MDNQEVHSTTSEAALRAATCKQAALQLESNFALLTALVNSPRDIIIFSLDKQYRYTAFNEKHREEMVKVWAANIQIGSCMLDFLENPALRAEAKASMDRALNGEVISEIQHQPDIDIYYDFNWNPVYLHKNVVGLTCFIKDITAQKQAQIALIKAKQLLAESQQIGKVGGWEFNIDTGKQIWADEVYRIHEVDNSFIPTIENGMDFYSPESRPCIQQAVQKTLDTGESFDVELEIITAKGNIRSVHAIGNADWEHRRVYGFFQDITERKQSEKTKKNLEDQLRQSQKLEAIGQLSSGIAHDFNNLLGGIIGHAELIKLNKITTADLKDHADHIILSCSKAADLTRQLLTFARKAPIAIQKIDCNAFIKQVTILMQRTIDHRIEIIVDVLDRPTWICVDRNQLENALLNMAINARDAMPDGGSLVLHTETIDLTENAIISNHFDIVPGLYVKISISDTGIGMSKEIQDRIFEPFFTTKEVGKGTTFDIYLPILTLGKPLTEEKDESVLVPGTGSLWVVDDQPLYHQVLSEMFTALGYTVRCFSSGKQAIELYQENIAMADLIILDLNMPKMSGLACFRALKTINPSVKVIVSTGYGDSAERETLGSEGVLAFVNKPYKSAELSHKIAEILGGR